MYKELNFLLIVVQYIYHYSKAKGGGRYVP